MEPEKKPQLMPINNFCKIQLTDVMTKRYDVYLNYIIDKPHHYFELLEVLRSAGEEDEVFIHLNNNGGYVDSVMQIINAMKESKANIITCLDGACHSGASLILLSGDIVKVSEHGSMLCHYYSGASIGKGHEIEAQIDFDKEYYKRFFSKIYNKFLDKKEIKSMIDGKDIWLSSKDVIKRLKRINK